MAITRLDAISIWDKPPNVTGAICYGYLDQVLSWELTRRLDAAHSALVVAPISGNAQAIGVERRILALHFAPLTPGTLGEVVALRISETEQTQSAEGLTFAMTARSLLFDWGDAGPLSYVYAGGFHEFAISGALDAPAWMAQYALPHLVRQGYDWYAFGCLNPLTIPRAFTRETALQLLNGCQDYLGNEVQIFPLGGGIAVELVAEVNGSLPPLRLSTGQSIRRASQRKATNEQATILVPFGAKGHSEKSRSIQGMTFGSTAEDLGTKELLAFPFSDSSWLFPVVQMSGQYVDPTGARTWYLQRVKTGRCFPIVQTLAAGSTTFAGGFTLGDLTYVPDGWYWSLREGRTPGTELDVAVPGFPLRVTSVASNVVTLNNPFTAADPVPTDDVHIDCKIRRSVLRLATTSTTVTAVAGSTTDVDLTVASTSGVAAGDWGFAHNSAVTPWTLFGKVFTVLQVISSTVVRVRKRYTFDTTAAPFGTGATVKQVQFYRAASTPIAFVNDEGAAANTITLDTAAGVVANDLIEYVMEGSGAMLTGLPSTTVATYGVARKDKDFQTARCLPNLALQVNPGFSNWVGAVPDLWTGTCVKVTTNLPGPGQINAAQLTGSSLHTLTSSPIWARPTSGDSKVSLRVRLRTGAGSFWDGSLASHRTVIQVLIAGTATVLGSATIIGPGYPSPPSNYVQVAPDTVVDVDVLAVDLLHTPGAGAKYAPWDGIQIKISAINGGGNVVLGGIFLTQDSALPSDGWMSEFGNQDLFGLGQIALESLDQPETANDIDTLDLQRALGAAYSADEIVEGRVVRVEVEGLGLFFEDRIAAATYRGTEDGTVQVQVATRTRQFADVLANYLTNT